jgi:hypothetical protein
VVDGLGMVMGEDQQSLRLSINQEFGEVAIKVWVGWVGIYSGFVPLLGRMGIVESLSFLDITFFTAGHTVVFFLVLVVQVTYVRTHAHIHYPHTHIYI